MINVEDLHKNNIKYSETMFNWMPQYYSLETSMFTPDGEFEKIGVKKYFQLWADKLNNQSGTKQYQVGFRPFSDGQKNVTVIRIMEDLIW